MLTKKKLILQALISIILIFLYLYVSLSKEYFVGSYIKYIISIIFNGLCFGWVLYDVHKIIRDW